MFFVFENSLFMVYSQKLFNVFNASETMNKILELNIVQARRTTLSFTLLIR